MIRRILNTPHPIGFGWAYALIPAFAVMFILIVLAPYGFAELNYADRIFVATPFGIITIFSAPFNLFVAKIFIPKYLDEQKWTIGRELLYDIYDILLISFWNSLYLFLAFPHEETFLTLFTRISIHTFLVGIIPLFFLIAYKHNKVLAQQLSLANRINEELATEIKSKKTEQEVLLHSENGAFEIKLQVSQILYFKSEGNYLEVYYLAADSQERKHLLRNRLKVIHGQLPENLFFQCHKRFIINLTKIAKVEGNARDLKVSLDNTNNLIPVSRHKVSNLLERLNR